MVTLNKFLRGCNTAVRAYQTEKKRQTKAQEKYEALMEAQSAFDAWSGYMDRIVSMHKDCSLTVDWHSGSDSGPTPPVKDDSGEREARHKLESFTPGFFEKLFGKAVARQKTLAEAVEHACEEDEERYKKKMQTYQKELARWEFENRIRKGVVAKDPEAYKQAISHHQFLSSFSELGTQFIFNCTEDTVDVDLIIHQDDLIPDYQLSLTSTGKLSQKNMPRTRFLELYQDHVCSSVLRVAREVFAFLPVTMARVNAICDIVSTKTGLLEQKTVLSAIIPRETLYRINWEHIDPSDCMANFLHAMSFKKTSGFQEVEKVPFPEMIH